MNYNVYGSEDSRFYYYPIVKNAHMSGIRFFENNFNFKSIKFTDVNTRKDAIFIVFIRDPIIRWLSGAAQYFHPYENIVPPDYKIDPMMLDLIFSAVCLDAHTRTQWDYLEGFNLKRCYFFDTDDVEFENRIKKFTKQFMGVDTLKDEFVKSNLITESPFKMNIRKQLKDAMESNPVYKENLLRYHKNDIEQINYIKTRHMYGKKFIVG